jgi:hypothetical protein
MMEKSPSQKHNDECQTKMQHPSYVQVQTMTSEIG